MMARSRDTETADSNDEPLDPGPRVRKQTSPIGQLLGQNMLDEAVRALQEDLAMLQAEQERGLSSLGGALQQIGQELGAVRTQLSALAEPLLAARPGLVPADSQREVDGVAVDLRLERLEKQAALLMRGLDTVDGLRHQSEVHTRALARLTDLVGEAVRPKPVEGLEELQQAVAAVEVSQRKQARTGRIASVLLGLGLTPGLGALVWLLLQRGV